MRIGATVGPNPAAVADVPDRFDFAELAVGEHEVRPREIDADDLRATLDAEGLDLTVHLPCRQPLATEVRELDAAHRRYLDRLLEFCAELDAEKAVVHATARDPGRERERAALDRQLRAVTESGRERGVELCVENVGQLPRGFGLDAVGLAVADADAALCFDVGHAHAEAGTDGVESFLDRHADRVSHLHVHDVRGRGDSHIPVGSGEVDFDSVADRMRGFDGTAAVELFTDDPEYLERSADRFAARFG